MNDFENCYCESNKGVAILGKMLNSKFYLIKFQMCEHFVFSVNNFENGYCENDKIHPFKQLFPLSFDVVAGLVKKLNQKWSCW